MGFRRIDRAKRRAGGGVSGAGSEGRVEAFVVFAVVFPDAGAEEGCDGVGLVEVS